MGTFVQCNRCKCWVYVVGLATASAWAAVHTDASCTEVQRRLRSDTICQRFVSEPAHGEHREPRTPSPARLQIVVSTTSVASSSAAFGSFPTIRRDG